MATDITWAVTSTDGQKICDIAFRASASPLLGDRFETEMDLRAVHLNGVPLDLDRLLKFDDADFLHDLLGIRANIDRNTGKLKNHFLPRCARS